MRILLVEDDQSIGKNIKTLLEDQNYITNWLTTGEDVAVEVAGGEYDLLILDIMLPDISGIEVLKLIREDKNNIPILLLTALGQIDNIKAGLDAGADDYLRKPFDVEELMARIRALLRRMPIVQSNMVAIGPKYKLDITKRILFDHQNQTVSLSPKEYGLLEYLSKKPDIPINRWELYDHVWGDNDGASNTVDVHIRYLRKKIKDDDGQIIKTVKGVGYMLCTK